MNIRLRAAQRQNGDVAQPKWVEDNASDEAAESALAAKLAEAATDVPTLPPMQPVASTKPAPAAPLGQAKPKDTINVRELMETLLEAWTNPSVRMWVDDKDLCFEQVDSETMTKNTWRVGFAHVRTVSVKLIK